jgi:hypothetical protein
MKAVEWMQMDWVKMQCLDCVNTNMNFITPIT